MLTHFQLSPKPEKQVFQLDKYLPPGSYAPALVIAGVDAAVGINSQSDPRPVLFRITGPAIAGVEGDTKREIDLTGCTVTGASYGDLSSEKVYVRLQQMTCLQGRLATVTQVQGLAAGSGKAGIRGPVVSREGDLIAKSFLAGLIGGVGEGTAQALAPASPASDAYQALDTEGALNAVGRQGVARGIGTSSNRIAEYLIRRAEQYQPVVSLNAGTRVELIFLDGAWLDGRSEEAAASERNASLASGSASPGVQFSTNTQIQGGGQ